jgi:serine/threonine protein kinase
MPEPLTQRTAVALLVGIGNYLHADRIVSLRFATHDAKALARMLTDPEVSGFARERVKLLTDRRAKRDNVVSSLSKWLPAQAKGADLVVIYFAGHGMVQRVAHREEGYLLPYDADPDDVITRGVPMSDVARWIEGIEAAAVVVCLDCCHAGKVIHRDVTGSHSSSRDMELRPAILQGMSGKGRFLIASCDEGQKSLEVEDLKHGLFTYHLLRGIEGAGDRDGDGKVGVAELFTYVSAAVAKDAREKFNSEQRPWTSAIWTDEAYVSFPKGRDTNQPLLAIIERIWREEGSEAAIRRIEKEMADADEHVLKQLLRLLGTKAHPAGIPSIFRCLCHTSESVRQHARKAVHAMGWDKVSAAALELPTRGNAEHTDLVLDGLTAFESHPQVTSLLDRLVAVLKGDQRNRAILLLEQKRLALELEKVASLFRELKSPYRIEKVLGQGLFTAELFRSGSARGPQSDFYSLGCVAYELLCGRPPFVSDNHHELVASHLQGIIPPPSSAGCRFGSGADQFLLRLLAPSAEKRYSNLNEAIRPIEHWASELAALGSQGVSTFVPAAESCTELIPTVPKVYPEETEGAKQPGHASKDDTAEIAPPSAPPSLETGPALGPFFDPLTQGGETPAPSLREGAVLGPESLAECDVAQSILSFSGTTASHLGPEERPSRRLQASPPMPERLGRYEILEPIGRGGMGAIYKARDVTLNRIVALKVLPTAGREGSEAFPSAGSMLRHQRFQREAQTAAQLSHPGVLSIFEIGEHEDLQYFVMPFIEGGSLAQHLDRYRSDLKAAIRLMEKVARAVHFAHNLGILHRDLKPANILLDRNGEPVVSDFGLAKYRAAEDVSLTMEGAIVGTPPYMSPEQATGHSETVGPASDIWSLGVILYQLLTGRQPFIGTGSLEILHKIATEAPVRPRTIHPDVDPDLEAICLKCLQSAPAKRYLSAEALADDLARWLKAERVSSRQSLQSKIWGLFSWRKS